MSRYERWLSRYVGKVVTVYLSEVAEKNVDFDWVPEDEDSNGEEGDPTLRGWGHIDTNYRPYAPNAWGEEANWSVSTGIDFETDHRGKITKIEMTAQVFGDDGLGDCYPEDVWKLEDYQCAKSFLEMIIGNNT